MRMHLYESAFFAILILGCECAPPGPLEDPKKPLFYASLPRHWPLYDIGFYNDTGGILSDVRFEFPACSRTYYCGAGYMVVAAAKRAGGGPDPIPAEGTIFWTTQDDGIQHRQHVVVASEVKGWWPFDGTIWLKIGKAGVMVEPVTDAESWRRADAQEPMVP